MHNNYKNVTNYIIFNRERQWNKMRRGEKRQDEARYIRDKASRGEARWNKTRRDEARHILLTFVWKSHVYYNNKIQLLYQMHANMYEMFFFIFSIQTWRRYIRTWVGYKKSLLDLFISKYVPKLGQCRGHPRTVYSFVREETGCFWHPLCEYTHKHTHTHILYIYIPFLFHPSPDLMPVWSRARPRARAFERRVVFTARNDQSVLHVLHAKTVFDYFDLRLKP